MAQSRVTHTDSGHHHRMLGALVGGGLATMISATLSLTHSTAIDILILAAAVGLVLAVYYTYETLTA